jgi:hypothetical protein
LVGRREKIQEWMISEKEKGQAFLLILDGLKNITPEKGVDPPLP